MTTVSTTYSLAWPVPGATLSAPNLAKALAAFQKSLPSIAKTEHADAGARGSYEYAGLDTVAQRVLPKLAEHGLSFTAYPRFTGDGKFALGYALLHVSGEYIAGEFPIPIVAEAQKMGSWLTYARRYCLLAVTGVHPGGEDDDGALAVTPTTPAADNGADGMTSRRPFPATENEAATTGGEDTAEAHVDEKAQVLASLAQELLKRDCSLNELKSQVYEVAKTERLLRANVINPFTGGMGTLSSVITYVRRQIEERNAEANAESGDGYSS